MLLLDVLPHLPLPQMFAATLLCGAIVCALVLFVVRLLLRTLGVGPGDVIAVRESLIGGLTTMFAIMVAFSAAEIWNDDVQGRAAVQREANALENIAALASVLPDALRKEVRDELFRFGRLAIDNDWPAMRRRVGPNEPLPEASEINPIVS